MKKIILYDINKDMCHFWKRYFNGVENVEIKNIDFKDLKCQTVVTAGNSFGWMTGGIDLAVRNYFGVRIQDSIQHSIITECGGELPVGEILLVNTYMEDKPLLAYVPTMRTPRKILPIDVFYVFTKILLFLESSKDINEIAIPGLGALTGGVGHLECAKQMRLAYEYVYNNEEKPKLDLTLIKEICKAHIAEHNEDGDVMFRCNQALQILEMIEEGTV